MTNTQKPTAIVIDDMQAMRSMVKLLLGATDCEVVGEAENGQLGLDLYIDTKPDLVLLDIDMPIKDGISTLKSILEHDAKANVIMMSTLSNMDIVESCIFAGAKDYITKDKELPVIKARLDDVIAEILK